jgi:hypothetical protein
MAKKNTNQQENPLLSKNIPQPPVIQEEQSTGENGETVQQQSGTLPQNSNTVESGKTVKQQKTVKITIYPSQEQLEKLYDLMEAYRKKTGVKINQQDIIRRIIDVADINTVLP